jgi:hypothetical protein
MNATRGSCVCGAVQFTLEGEALAFQYCHCSRCRKGSGSAHCANLFLKPEGLEFQAGEELIRRFDLPDAKYWSHAFCTVCGSPAPVLSRTGRAWMVPAGALDDDPGVQPTRNIFVSSGAPWFVPTHELPEHDQS